MNDSYKVESKTTFFLTIMLVLFIISFQIQWTSTLVQNTEIRLSISDLLLPILFFGFLLKALQQGFVSTVSILRWPLWFLAFTSWFGVSVLIGCNEVGYCSSWAFVNKFLGWFMLAFYFYLGNLIEHNNPKAVDTLLKTMFASSGIISIFSIALYFLFKPHHSTFGVNDDGRFIGFLVNPNAYGLFSTFVVILQIPFLAQKKLLSDLMHWCILLPNIAVILLSGSRTAMIAFGVGIISFILHKALPRKKIFIAILMGLTLLSLIDLQKVNNYLYTRVTEFYILDHAAEERLDSTTQAMNWWIEKPLTGIGLGSFLVKQEQQNITPKITIHNTPIWLLTETGLIGLLLYGWFLFNGRNEVARKVKEGAGNLLAQGMLAIFPAFIVASVTTEIFYQRYVWFFLGLVLAKQKLVEINTVGLRETLKRKLSLLFSVRQG